MLGLKVFLCFVFLSVTASQAFAESISEAAARISKARDQKEELEKNNVKIGESIQDIGDLSIEDFLKLDAVPDGMDAVSAQMLYNAPNNFNFMTEDQALQAIATMRKNGVVLPEDLEENIKKDPKKASEFMNEAFENIPAEDVKDEKDIAKYRKSAIKDAENNLGIRFKDILEQQKRMMTPESQTKGKRRGRK